MKDIRPIVRSHHERWDGRGYPDGLAGEAIPLLARVVAVADAFDAMTTRRPYNTNQVKTPEQAFAEVERCAGTQFDPKCAAALPGGPGQGAGGDADEPDDGDVLRAGELQ